LCPAGRAQRALELSGPARRSGGWVITDRSVYSSLAYQGAGRGLGIDAVRAVNEPGLGDVWPELVVLLRLDAETGLARQNDPDRIGREGVTFQTTVAEAFDNLAQVEPGRFVVVDAALDVESVWQQVLTHVEGRWAISLKQ